MTSFKTRKRDGQVFPTDRKSSRDSGNPSYVGVDKSQIDDSSIRDKRIERSIQKKYGSTDKQIQESIRKKSEAWRNPKKKQVYLVAVKVKNKTEIFEFDTKKKRIDYLKSVKSLADKYPKRMQWAVANAPSGTKIKERKSNPKRKSVSKKKKTGSIFNELGV